MVTRSTLEWLVKALRLRHLLMLLGIRIYAVRSHVLGRSPAPPELPAHLRVGIVDSATLLRAAEDPELGLSHDFVKFALARGDVAFGAMHGDRLVAYTWRTFTEAPHEHGLWVRVRPPYRYGYKAFTHPSYRGLHLNAAISLSSDAYFLERGYTHHVGFVDIWNRASLATGKYKGNSVIGFAGYLRWFGRYVPFRTPGVKRTGFEFFAPAGSLAATAGSGSMRQSGGAGEGRGLR